MRERDADYSTSEEELYRRAYEELKRMASRHLRSTNGSATLSTTELVHESYLKLQGGSGADWQGRAHFFGAASRAMRQVLVDFARRRGAAKRGGDATRISIGEASDELQIELDEILALDEALDRLGAVDERLRQIVELRFFGGLTIEETAEVLQVSQATVKNDWSLARGWLYRELQRLTDK